MARIAGRQYPLVLTFSVDYTELLLAGAVFGQLPPGAVIIGGESVIDVASDDTGVATMTVTVGTEEVITTQDVKATAGTRVALTLLAEVHTVADDVTCTLAVGNEDAAVGTVRINIMYIIGGRANEVGEPGDT